MRVKISYGAEMKEVPEEIDHLFTYVSEKVRNLQRQLEITEQSLADQEIETALTLMEKMRQTMSNVDMRLADLSMISAGYLEYKQGESDVSSGRSTVDTITDGSDDTETKQSSSN